MDKDCSRAMRRVWSFRSAVYCEHSAMCSPQDEGCDISSTTTESMLDISLAIETNIPSTGLRLWQLLFICGSSLMAVVVFLCCCIRFRIPRTKQEIEADYVRKKITRKFQKQLRMIQNSEMDEMDLKKALERIRAEFKSDTESLAQSEVYSGDSISSVGAEGQPKQGSPHHLQPHLGIPIETAHENCTGGFRNRIAKIIGSIRFTRTQKETNNQDDILS